MKNNHQLGPFAGSLFLLISAWLLAPESYAQAEYPIGDPITGVRTVESPRDGQNAYRVTWINWDSGFRGSGLKLGDIIVGANERFFAHTIRDKRQSPGDYAEDDFWRELGVASGENVTLMIQRDDDIVHIVGALSPLYSYAGADGQRQLFPGGPRPMSNDGFQSGAWSQWYDDLVRRMAVAEARGYGNRDYDSVSAFEAFDADKDRLAYLVEKHPSEFANTLLNDWKSARSAARGEKIELTEDDLAYRELGQKRKARIAAQASAAEKALIASLQDQRISPFPMVDPIEGYRDDIVGKIVVFDTVGPRNLVSESGRLHIAIGDQQNGYYFGDYLSREMAQVRKAIERYRRKVDPAINESYRFIGEIREDPRMIIINEEPVAGNAFDIVGAMVGDAFFIDFSGPREAEQQFAGEEELSSYMARPPVDEYSASAVMEAFVDAIKVGDEEAWKGLFATWKIVTARNGESELQSDVALSERDLQYAWQQSRKNILGDIYDVRVVSVSDPYPILTSEVSDEERELDQLLGLDDASGGVSTTGAAEDAPFVEQCIVVVTHVHKLGASYRPVTKRQLNRVWPMQRVDGGPWRIAVVDDL